MFFLLEPDKNYIRRFLDKQRQAQFSYGEVGLSRYNIPSGYNIDHNRIRIGTGQIAFEKAVEAVKNWKMFNLSWVKVYPAKAPIEESVDVVVTVKHFGFWSLNANRIVYILDEKGDVEKYGFAYGTLNDHGERGEERFSVEFHHSTQDVWYDLLAFSKPNHWLAKVGYPFSRYFQKRFAADSKLAMLQVVSF